jgi:hypothetical protein
MNSKIKLFKDGTAWRQAMFFVRSVAAMALASLCALTISGLGGTHMWIAPELRALNDTLALLGAISGHAESPGNLGGQMPPSFDQDVARVVAEIDRIEAGALNQMDRTGLDR